MTRNARNRIISMVGAVVVGAVVAAALVAAIPQTGSANVVVAGCPGDLDQNRAVSISDISVATQRFVDEGSGSVAMMQQSIGNFGTQC